MTHKFSRRDFLKVGVSAGAAAVLGDGKMALSRPQNSRKMIVIASGNGMRAVDKAMELLKSGTDPLDAVIAGVNIVEEDPNDMSVGYGGLPNEDMEVELDASVMHGPTHNAGAVAGLKHIKTPSKVAKLVMERTDHALLVGEGALKFAKAHGFKEENLLTDRASHQLFYRPKGLVTQIGRLLLARSLCDDPYCGFGVRPSDVNPAVRPGDLHSVREVRRLLRIVVGDHSHKGNRVHAVQFARSLHDMVFR